MATDRPARVRPGAAANRELLWLRAELIARLGAAIAAHRLGVGEAAALCGFGQSELAGLLAGHRVDVPTEVLLGALTRVGVEVELRCTLGSQRLGGDLLLSQGLVLDS